MIAIFSITCFMKIGDLFIENLQYMFTLLLQYRFKVKHFDALWAPFLIYQKKCLDRRCGASFVSIEQKLQEKTCLQCFTVFEKNRVPQEMLQSGE